MTRWFYLFCVFFALIFNSFNGLAEGQSTSSGKRSKTIYYIGGQHDNRATLPSISKRDVRLSQSKKKQIKKSIWDSATSMAVRDREEAAESFFDKIKAGSTGDFGEESIDYFGGGVSLSYVDVNLPGPNGFDLKIYRIYNSKIFKDKELDPPTIMDFQANPSSWVGFGWSMHMGQVYNWDPLQPDALPVIIFPDGRSEKAYPPEGTNAATDLTYKTKSFLIYKKASRTLFFPDGTQWIFSNPNDPNSTGVKNITYGYYNLGNCLVVEKIINPQGFTITISYHQDINNPTITQIVDALGRTVYFETDTLGTRLQKIYYQSGTDGLNPVYTEYHYNVSSYTSNNSYFKLDSFTPPDLGGAITYQYYDDNNGAFPKYELQKISTPFGGQVTYAYDNHLFYYYWNETIYTRVMNAKTIQFSPVGQIYSWSIEYPDYHNDPEVPDDTADRTVDISGPEFDTHITFHMLRILEEGDPDYELDWYKVDPNWWLTGSPEKKWITEKNQNTPLLTEEYTYTPYLVVNDSRYNEKLSTYGIFGTWKFPIYAKLQSSTKVSKPGDPTVITNYGYTYPVNDPRHFLLDYGLPVHVYTWIVNEKNQEQMVALKEIFYFFESEVGATPHFTDEYMVNYRSREVDSVVESFDPQTNLIHSFKEKETQTDYYNDPLQPEFGLVKSESKLKEIYINESSYVEIFTDWQISYPTFTAATIIKKVDLPGTGGIETYEYQSGQLAKYEKPINEAGTSSYVVYNRTICPFTGRVISETNQHGGIIHYTYDKLGRITLMDLPDSQPENFGDINVTWGLNQVTITQNSGSGTITLRKFWDGFNRDLGMEEESSNPALLLYSRKILDAEGRVKLETKGSLENDLAHSFEYDYNAVGQITEMRDPLNKSANKKTIYTYGDRQKTVTDTAGRTTVFHSTFLPGLITKVIDPGNQTAINVFDVFGRLLYTSYQGERIQTYAYNNMDLLITETHPESGTISYVYDAANNLWKKFWGNSVGEFIYNPAGQVIEQRYSQFSDPQNPEEVVSYSYDTQGRPTDITSSQGWSRGQFTYNVLGSLTQEAQLVPPLTASLVTGYAYDGCNNLKSMTYPSGRTVSYQNNDLNLPSQVQFGSSNKTIISNMIYGSNKQVEQIYYGNNTKLINTYDLLGRLDETRTEKMDGMGTDLLKMEYAYDSIGNITDIADLKGNDLSASYQYDVYNRLIQANYTGAGDYSKQYQYTYDPYGNMLSADNGQEQTYLTYDSQNRHNDGSTTYDSRGNVAGNLNFIFQRDLQNRITNMQHRNSGLITGNYLYDERGLRLRAEREPKDKIFIQFPQSGAVLSASHTYTIKWESFNPAAEIKIEYFDGAAWQPVTSQTANDGSFDWTIDDITTAACKLRISDLGGTVLAESAADFSIVSANAPSLNLMSLLGGEILYQGQSCQVNWLKTGTTDPVKVEFSSNGGTNYSILVSSTDQSAYLWNIPLITSSSCLFRISTIGGSGLVHSSYSPFHIISNTTPQLTLTFPNGGEQFEANSTQTITWSASGALTNVVLEFFDGLQWTAIATVPASIQSHSWQVPQTQHANCKIRIKGAANGLPVDESNGEFSIITAGTASISLTAPTAGAVFTTGSTMEIKWFSTGTVGDVKIELSRNGGIDFETIIASTANTGSVNWPVSGSSSSNCCLRLMDAAAGNPQSNQSGIFSIHALPTVQVLTPTAAELVVKGNFYDITWSADSEISHVKIEFSENNGQSYTLLTDYTANDGAFQWFVPLLDSQQCLIKISAADNAAIYSQSALFTIGDLPSLTVTYPNGGESLNANSVQTIAWDSTGMVGELKLEYSYDQGASFIQIPGAESVFNNGQFSWTVPNTPSNYCLVRISEASDGNPVDVSNNPFEIKTSSTGSVVMVSDVSSFDIDGLIQFQDKLYFNAQDGMNGSQLWKYDGTNPAEMILINPIGDAFNVYTDNTKAVIYNNKLYFGAKDDTSYTSYFDLWAYDETNGPVKIELNADHNFSPRNLIIFNNKLNFSGADISNGYELWQYDGINSPVLYDIYAGSTDSNPFYFNVFNNRLCFSAVFRNKGREFGVFDGTNIPAYYDVNSNQKDDSNPNYFTEFNGKLYFSAITADYANELIMYDGINAPSPVTTFFDYLNSSMKVFLVFQDKLYFRANDNDGYELYAYDGINTPTMVSNINPSYNSSNPDRLTVFNNTLYFVANNGSQGKEMWKYMGYGSPVMMELNPNGDSEPFLDESIEYNGNLFFSANDGSHGRELWKYDGVNSPELLMDINPTGNSNPSDFIIYQSRLYFCADDGVNGIKLFMYREPSLQLISPNTGENWTTGYVQNITWASSSLTSTLTIDLYKGELFQNNITVVPITDGTYIWQVPENIIFGTDYRIYIHQGEIGSFSGYFSITSSCPAQIVSKMYQSQITSNSAFVSWYSVPEALYYKLLYREVGAADWLEIITSNPSEPLENLTSATQYEWCVVSVCAGGDESVHSESRFFTTLAPCPAQTTDKMYDGNVDTTSIILNWNSVSGAQSYILLFRESNVGATWIEYPTSPPSYEMTGLTPDTDYDWCVISVCAYGEQSVPSGIRTFHTLAECLPQTTDNMYQNQITSSSVQLGWNSVANAASYILLYRMVGQPDWIELFTSPPSYSLTNLLSNTQYEWCVVSLCNNGDESIPSGTRSFTTYSDCQPQIVTKMYQSQITSISAYVSWSSVFGAQSYKVLIREAAVGGAWTEIPRSAPSYTFTGLTPSSQYEWCMKSVCAYGVESPMSASRSFTTLAPCVPQTVDKMYQSSITSTSAHVSWNSVSGALTYIALLREVSVGGDWWEYPTSAPSSDFTGLNPATQYEWCVISVCAGGVESLPSGTRTFQTLSGRNRNWPAPPLPGNGSLQIAKSNGVLVAEAFMNVESGKILNGGDISQAPTRPADFSADQIMPESSLTPIKEPSSATNGGNRSETETTIYIYGLANQLLAEYNGAGECMKEYIYVGTKLVAEYTPTENQYDYYTSDQINSSKLITDDTGSVVYHAAHGPYGDIQKTFTNTKDPNPKFSGKEREAYSNLDYFGARYYSSRTARFDAVDPIMNKDEAMSNPQLWNLYSYCRNNPVSFFDPDGNTEKDIVLLKALFNLRVQQMTMRKERIGNGYIGGARNNVHITQTLIVPFLLENILGIDVTWETNLKSCGDQSEAMVYSFKRASGDKEDNYESFRVLEDNWKFKTVTNSTKTHTWISGESDTGEFVKIDPLFNKFRAGKFEDNKLLYWENYSEKFREQYLNSPTKE